MWRRRQLIRRIEGMDGDEIRRLDESGNKAYCWA